MLTTTQREKSSGNRLRHAGVPREAAMRLVNHSSELSRAHFLYLYQVPLSYRAKQFQVWHLNATSSELHEVHFQ
jgi:hypothetical protein